MVVFVQSEHFEMQHHLFFPKKRGGGRQIGSNIKCKNVKTQYRICLLQCNNNFYGDK